MPKFQTLDFILKPIGKQADRVGVVSLLLAGLMSVWPAARVMVAVLLMLLNSRTILDG